MENLYHLLKVHWQVNKIIFRNHLVWVISPSIVACTVLIQHRQKHLLTTKYFKNFNTLQAKGSMIHHYYLIALFWTNEFSL